MKKILSAISFILLSTVAISAQDFGATDNMFAPSHELSVGYGIFPATDYIRMFTTIFDDIMDTGNRTGAVSLSYVYKLNDVVGVGGAIAFAGYSGNSVMPGEAVYKNYYSVIPQAKFNWYNSRLVTLYSRAGAGITLVALRGRYNTPDDPAYSRTKAAFTWQLSPIGVEVGKTFAGYAEAGFGAMGSFMLGLRARF